MIPHRLLLSAAVITLAGCCAKPPYGEPPAEPRRPATPAGEAARGETQTYLQLTYHEFIVPAELTAELASGKPDFEKLMAAAKSGRIRMECAFSPVKDACSSCLKSVTTVRYPESHGVQWPGSEPAQVNIPAPSVPPGQPVQVIVKAEPAAPLPADLKPVVTPQDYTEREVGLILEWTPMNHPEIAELDIKLRRSVVDAEYGATKDPSGLPSPPAFAMHQVETRVKIPYGTAVPIATITPSPGSAKPVVRIAFIRLDKNL